MLHLEPLCVQVLNNMYIRGFGPQQVEVKVLMYVDDVSCSQCQQSKREIGNENGYALYVHPSGVQNFEKSTRV